MKYPNVKKKKKFKGLDFVLCVKVHKDEKKNKK